MQESAGELVVVYESIAVDHPDGAATLISEIGELTEDTLQRVGRPYSYLHEAFLFHEQAWQVDLEDGLVQRGYRVIRTPNPSPIEPPPQLGPVVLDAVLADFDGAQGERRLVTIGLRTYPDWAPPLRSPLLQSAELALASEDARQAYSAARKQLFGERAAPILAILAHTGGAFVGDGYQSGWITAWITPESLAQLATRADVAHISERTNVIGGPQADWALGQSGTAARMGSNVFHAAGYTGETANSARHGYDDITVAVLDNELEDESCFLYDGCEGFGCVYYTGCSGTSRLKERIECNDLDGDGDLCETTANFVGVLDDSTVNYHGTSVASIILGDYSDDQGKGKPLNDPAWTSGNHSAAWEQDRTGFAPEASLIMVAYQKQNDPALPWWEAIAEMEARHVDVLNFSSGYYLSSICDPVVHQDYEYAAENAYDDGVLFVASAGNTLPSAASPGPYGCGAASPGHLLKVLSVTSFPTGTIGCDTNINTCRRSSAFVKGPMAAKLPDGTLSAPDITSIDLVAPTGLDLATDGSGSFGNPYSDLGGTSGAAPVVSGVAALVKDHMLASGNSWINSPGRLHTLMLLMGDRYMEIGGPGGTLAQNTVAGEPDWGFGKIRPRLFGSGGGLGSLATAFATWSFTSSSGSLASTLWTSPMPSDTRMLKCVLFQTEDMSNGKDRISSLDLQLETYAPTFGGCTLSGGSVVSLSDNSHDVKSMVAHAANLANRCARATIHKNAVSAWGVTAHLFCYRSNVRDHETPVP